MTGNGEKPVFTGERFLPSETGNIALEHLHRYHVAKHICDGKDVLDIACGEGYGSALIGKKARSVVGVDIDRDIVAYASKTYVKRNIKFKVGSCVEIPADNASFDVIVCFETIEHVDDHLSTLIEFRRVLRPDGILLISSPDKENYSDARDFSNEYHVRELYANEFEDFIRSKFKHVSFLSQKVGFGSIMLPDSEPAAAESYHYQNGKVDSFPGLPKPMFRLAIASDEPFELPRLGLFEQPINDSEVILSWERVMAQRDREIDQLKASLDRMNAQVGQAPGRDDGLREPTEWRSAQADHQQARTDSIRSLEAKADTLGQDLHDIKRIMEAVDRNIAADRRHYNESLARLSAAMIDNQRERERADLLKQHLDDIRVSTSWRLTSPLRSLKDLGTRLRSMLSGGIGAGQPAARPADAIALDADAVVPAQLLARDATWGIVCTPHTEFIARCIGERLRSHGVSSFVTTSMPEAFDATVYVVLCPQMFKVLPPRSKRIVFQLEQSVSSRWFTSDYFKAIGESFAILEYSLKNIAYLDANAIRFPQVHYLPIGTSLNPRPPVDVDSEFDCDFLFYGDELSSPRRQRMLAALRERFKVVVCNNLFGEEMSAQIRRARAIVNIHYYENALLEMPRIQESLSLGTPILSESTSDQDEYPELRGAVLFFEQGSIESMLASATALLGNIDRHRAAVAEAQALGAERFTFMFDRFLAAIGALPAGEISKKPIYVSDESNVIALSLPETIARRTLLEACIPDEASIFDGIRFSPGWVGAASSFCALARHAQSKNFPRLTVFEDDVLFKEEFGDKIDAIHEYLDDNNGQWDVFCGLIADLHPDCRVLRVDVFKGIRFVTIDKMVSMVYNIYSPAAINIIANWDADDANVETNTIDRFLEAHEGLRVVVALPFVVGHREDADSTLWGFQNTQYSDMIATSEQKLVVLADKFEAQRT